MSPLQNAARMRVGFRPAGRSSLPSWLARTRVPGPGAHKATYWLGHGGYRHFMNIDAMLPMNHWSNIYESNRIKWDFPWCSIWFMDIWFIHTFTNINGPVTNEVVQSHGVWYLKTSRAFRRFWILTIGEASWSWIIYFWMLATDVRCAPLVCRIWGGCRQRYRAWMIWDTKITGTVLSDIKSRVANIFGGWNLDVRFHGPISQWQGCSVGVEVG